MHGPHASPPVTGLHTSPMLSRSKPNSANRQIIVDFSWPQDAAVNTSLDSEFHLNSLCKLSHPTIDHVIDAVVQCERVGKCYMYM